MKKAYPGHTVISVGIFIAASIVSTLLPGKQISQSEHPEPVIYYQLTYISTSHPIYYSLRNSLNKRREVFVSAETITLKPAFFLKGTINKRLGFSKPGLI